MVRFAVQMLFFDCENLILQAIANTAPHVERIYVTYSKLPWNYNPSARNEFVNSGDVSILQKSPFREQVTVIEGDWTSEEEQRNACLDRAREDGFDYLIVQDADEFYLPEEFEKNLAEIRRHSDHHYYRNPWYLFWKSTRHVIQHHAVMTYRNGKVITAERNVLHNYSMAFALNLRKETSFRAKRVPNQLDEYMMLPGHCHHLSWVYSDAQVLRKLFTWGHSHQVYDRMLWYRVKWLGWTEATRNLHPVNPIGYRRAVPYEGPVPREIADFNAGEQSYSPPRAADLLHVNMYDAMARLRTGIQGVRRSVRPKVR
jgi:glycosyltransferase involved in cell wall biosynthesis